MNVENLNKLISYVETRDRKTIDFGSHRDCVIGMAARAFGTGDSAKEALVDTLDITTKQAIAIYRMHGGNWRQFEEMSLADQNDTVAGMLRHLRDTGEVKWNELAPINIEDQMAVDSDTDVNDH